MFKTLFPEIFLINVTDLKNLHVPVENQTGDPSI